MTTARKYQIIEMMYKATVYLKQSDYLICPKDYWGFSPTHSLGRLYTDTVNCE